MPLYEYRCDECGAVTELLQKFSDEPLTTCPHCSGRVRKLISRSSFQLKGSGWYLTDYARKNSPSQEKSKGKEEKSSTPTSSTSSTKDAKE
jgi:putative FmdB family regulatory protein